MKAGSKRKLLAALKAAVLVALIWAAVPALVAALIAIGSLFERHGEAVHVGCLVAVVIGFSSVAGSAFYCMFRGRPGGCDAE